MGVPNITDPLSLKEARKNAREIQSNIPKLIRIFMHQRDKREKFEKEFNTYIKNSDLKNYYQVFLDLQVLWQKHLTTSYEEVDSVTR